MVGVVAVGVAVVVVVIVAVFAVAVVKVVAGVRCFSRSRCANSRGR